MTSLPPYPRLLSAALAALTLTTAASAATFTYVGTAGTESPTWNASNAWTPSGVPTAGTLEDPNIYIVSNGHVLRTTLNASSEFSGYTLSISGQLNLQGNTGGTQTANIVVNDGAVIVNARTGTQTLAGTLQLGTGTHYLKSTGTTGPGEARNIIFETLVSGAADATAHFLRNGTFTLNNTGNTFAGTWRAGGSASVQAATVSNNSTVISTIKAATTGSLGINASVALDAWSRFDADFDWTTTGSLTLASNDGNATSLIVTLDQDFTVGLLSIAGNAIAARPQAYTYTDLFNLGYGDYFTDGGGSITVSAIPEPSAAALFIGFASLVVVICPRRRNAKPSAAPAA